MSAIFGIFYRDDRQIDPVVLDRMVDILAHRGPDGAEVWHEGPIGLGHRMLRTTPESLWEKLPLVSRRAGLALTADARLDNRDELIHVLGLTDRPVMEITDSDLILAAYEKWETDCPEKFLGDFAFAIWDRRQQTLFCARDHFGVKPFYYHASDRAFVFSTESKAILSLPEVPHRLNEVSVADQFLAPVQDDPTITFYESIRRLPPAHTMTVSANSTKYQKYWSLDPSRDICLGSDEAYAEALRELFTEAVRCRLRSAYPVGSMLSGGLDSSSIACVAQRLLAQNGVERLPTFSGIFDQVPQSNERHYIQAVLDQGRFEPHYLYTEQVGPLADLDRMLWHQDEPFLGANLYISWGLYQPAQARGVRVLLDGFDGDTTVSHGYEYLVELACTGQWLALASALNAYTRVSHGPAWPRVLFRYLRVYNQTLKRIHQMWRVMRRRPLLLNGAPDSTILNPIFARRIRVRERHQSPQRPRTAREHHFHLLTRAIMPYFLEVLDRAAGAFDIELRFPFFDRRLVEFCLALPAQQKLYQGWERGVMRRAMTDILPPDVQWRSRKANLQPGFDYALMACEQKHLKKWFLKDRESIEEYIDIDALRGAYYRLESQQAKPEDGHSIWKAVVLARWLQHITGNPEI